MKIENNPIQIDFAVILNVYKSISTVHPKHLFFKQIISAYDCFDEKDVKFSKWTNARKPAHLNNNNNTNKAHTHTKVRVKTIGNLDMTEASIFKQKLILSLNKITDKNFQTIFDTIRSIFKIKHCDMFLTILLDYFKNQPTFQSIYITLFKKLLIDDTENTMISNITSLWHTYIQNEEWKIGYKLVEDSHNYDDFCEYIKEKKKLNATAQCWARFIEIGIIDVPDRFEWCNTVLSHALDLDVSNLVYRSMVDSYIEQIREYCKNTVQRPPELFIANVIVLRERPIQKSTKFKIMDFIEDILQVHDKKDLL